jgi:hypothetical protein
MGFFEKVVIATVASIVVLSLERAGLLGVVLDSVINAFSGVMNWLFRQVAFLSLQVV